MDRIQLVAIAVTTALFALIFELVRRRRLMERYALLWLLSSVVLLVLAVWTGLLERIANTFGFEVPSNALFVVGFAFVLALLLNFSLAISRLSDETKILAQQVARLDHEARAAKHELDSLESRSPESPAPREQAVARQNE